MSEMLCSSCFPLVYWLLHVCLKIAFIAVASQKLCLAVLVGNLWKRRVKAYRADAFLQCSGNLAIDTSYWSPHVWRRKQSKLTKSKQQSGKKEKKKKKITLKVRKKNIKQSKTANTVFFCFCFVLFSGKKFLSSKQSKNKKAGKEYLSALLCSMKCQLLSYLGFKP